MADYDVPMPKPVKTGTSPISPAQGGWAGTNKDSDTKKGK